MDDSSGIEQRTAVNSASRESPIGVSAFENCHQLRRNRLLIGAMSTGSLNSDTPICRYVYALGPEEPGGQINREREDHCIKKERE
jgi:hypothetical protein